MGLAQVKREGVRRAITVRSTWTRTWSRSGGRRVSLATWSQTWTRTPVTRRWMQGPVSHGCWRGDSMRELEVLP